MIDESIDDGVTLKHFNNELDAELLVKNLISQGIFVFIKKEDPATISLFRGASVIVRKSDKNKALEILKDLKF